VEQTDGANFCGVQCLLEQLAELLVVVITFICNVIRVVYG